MDYHDDMAEMGSHDDTAMIEVELVEPRQEEFPDLRLPGVQKEENLQKLVSLALLLSVLVALVC